MKQKKKLSYGLKLTIAMSVYALVFVCVAYFGFSWFWDYIEAYENSRPSHTIESYMAQLDAQDVIDGSQDLIGSIDHNIQSEDACREVITKAVSGGISYARKLNECTDTSTVYMLLSGGKTIGKVTLTAQAADEFGFTPWVVTGDSFDMSFLIGQGTSVTVPHNFSVYVNGTALSGDYITETGLQYALLKDHYDTYELPYMVTYEVAPILGDLEVSITDPQGDPVTEEIWADEATFLSTCTQEQLDGLHAFSKDFILAYVNYTTNSNGSRHENYAKIKPYLVPDSPLYRRIEKALDGLAWVTNRYAELISVELDQCIPTLDGRFICDITYRAKAIDITYDKVEHTYTVQLILTQTETGYLAEAMTNN